MHSLHNSAVLATSVWIVFVFGTYHHEDFRILKEVVNDSDSTSLKNVKASDGDPK